MTSHSTERKRSQQEDPALTEVSALESVFLKVRRIQEEQVQKEERLRTEQVQREEDLKVEIRLRDDAIYRMQQQLT
ncbi:hypothetical protein PUN28_016908 [Cardiocondyla obscurior]|uniref:Uncharacterized protein n=1 Tax=Cardiocondyla obscurior TaxID=286306 RepID=A0AAW2EP97_9HYME